MAASLNMTQTALICSISTTCTTKKWTQVARLKSGRITVRVAEGVEEFSVDDNEVSPKKTIAHRDAQEVTHVQQAALLLKARPHGVVCVEGNPF
jgi:hypothetical protein